MPFVVSFIVNKHTNEIQSIDVLYAVNAKKEVAALDKPEFRPINGTALTTSAISISILLDYVNYYFPDILLESILKHFENKFYIHNMNLQNKNETVSLNAKDKESRGLNSYDLSRTDNIANNASNVNNNDTKLSRDVDIDEFDETEYTNVKLSKAEYNKLYFEALTWDSDKVGKVCHKYLNNVYYYYTLDNDYNLTVIKMKKSENIHERKDVNNVNTDRRDISGGHEISENFDGYNNGDIRFAGDGRTTANNVELDKEKIQREGDSDGRRNIKNDNNDNLSEEKY